MAPPDPSSPHADRTVSPTAVIELCVNLDDVTGQLVGAVFNELLDAGALDVWTTAITMKKQRPGVMLSLLCTPQDADRLTQTLLHSTGSFGVRRRAWDRTVLNRRFVEVDTTLGQARVKVGELDGQPLVATPEYDAVAELAADAQVTVREAMSTVQVAAQRWLESQRTP